MTAGPVHLGAEVGGAEGVVTAGSPGRALGQRFLRLECVSGWGGGTVYSGPCVAAWLRPVCDAVTLPGPRHTPGPWSGPKPTAHVVMNRRGVGASSFLPILLQS